MLKIEIISVGKTKENWLKQALELYQKRLKSQVDIQFILLKNNEQLEQKLEDKSFIIMDLDGDLLNSPSFSKQLFADLEAGGSRLSYVIGGNEGLSQKLKKEAKRSLCLSPLTFTHQMARLILVEQIYRSFEIKKGSGYHK